MRKSLALLSSLAVGLSAISAVPTVAQAHWWWYGSGSSGSSGSGTSGSTNTSSTVAGFSRTYVSPGGDDANGCSVNDPCRTFQRAHDRTFINGEINCTESGGYGSVNITKSITIDCKEVPASINAGVANGVGVTINIASSANDPLRVVRLRGFTISGAGGQTATSTAVTGIGTRVGVRGIAILAASAVYIEHLVISDFTAQAILDTRSVGPTKLFILDTVTRNNGGSAIVPLVTSPNAATVLDNVRSEGNNYGLAVGPGNTAMVSRSVFSGNTVAGVEVDVGGLVAVNGSVMSHNGSGLLTGSPGSRLSNSDIAFNTTGVTGSWISYGNNRLSGNTSSGTAPTAAAQQ